LLSAKRTLSTLEQEFSEAELLLDERASGNIHSLFVRGDQEMVDDLFVVDRSGWMQRFSELSKIVEKIPKRFWVIRIFAYFSDDDQRTAVAQRVREITS
jgi:hypothetical protein